MISKDETPPLMKNNKKERSDNGKKETNNKDKNDKKDKNEENNNNSSGIYIFIKIMIIIIIIYNIAIFLFSGMNHLILFIPSITSAIRIFIGFNNNIYDYAYKGLVLFIMCLICQIIKFIFRFILTYFIIKKDNNSKGNILDYEFIEFKNVLWINDFDIKINGTATLIIYIVFFAVWLFIIILVQFQKKKFPKNKDSSKYEEIINLYYSCHNSRDNTNLAS